MKHFILLFSLFLAPAFANKGSLNTNQNFSSNNASHKRLKRDWIWNQLHIKEEIDTPLPHHVGKVNSGLLEHLEVQTAEEYLEKYHLFAV